MEATRFWVAVSRNYVTDKEYIFVDPKEDFINHLKEADCVVMHNAFGHDRPLIHRILGYQIPREKVLDTLILSKFLDPDRQVPSGWKGQHKPHSVEAWGMRLGVAKPEHEDWSQYSDEMLHRCRKDTEIQAKILRLLLREFQEKYGKVNA